MSKVNVFTITIFFITLSDAIISYWVPNLVESSLGNAVLMFIIISFQSVVGLLADLIFPKLLKKTHVRRFLFLSIITCLATLFLLVAASVKPLILMFLLAMATWGVYYEFIGFAQYQFVAESVPVTNRVGAWGIIGVFRNLSFFLGPLLAASILLRGTFLLIVVVAILLSMATLIALTGEKVPEEPVEITPSKMNIFEEMGHWLTLSRRVWPMIVVSLVMGAIDATFWTTGAVMTGKLTQVHPLGSLFLSLYALPSLVTGFVIARLGISKGKKKLAEIFLLLSGLPLLVMGVSGNIYWLFGVVLLSSLFLAVFYPFAESVYSDINARLGDEKKHMIGLTGSVINLSYIVWPIVAGVITARLGETMTFTVVGIITIITSAILLAITPKKLKLPQSQIATWKD